MQRSTRHWRKSRREVTLISPPTISRVCRIWWPLLRFVGAACSFSNRGRNLLFLTQESLRIHPIAVDIERTPIQDDILPLTKPIIGTSGRVYTELPVPKGTAVTISTIGYNLYILCPKPSPRCSALTIVLVAEIRVCGVQTLMSFDRSAGSKWTNRWSRLLVCMGTCTVTHGVLKESMSIDLSSTQLYILRRC